MHNHRPRAGLYRRVKHLTNIGEHEEASALYAELLARKFEEIDKHRNTNRTNLRSSDCKTHNTKESNDRI